jgi:hypothetical protein
VHGVVFTSLTATAWGGETRKTACNSGRLR